MTSAEPTPAKLKVGLLLGRDLRAAAWVATLVQRIQATGCADITLLVVDASPAPAPTPGWGDRLRQAPGPDPAVDVAAPSGPFAAALWPGPGTAA